MSFKIILLPPDHRHRHVSPLRECNIDATKAGTRFEGDDDAIVNLMT